MLWSRLLALEPEESESSCSFGSGRCVWPPLLFRQISTRPGIGQSQGTRLDMMTDRGAALRYFRKQPKWLQRWLICIYIYINFVIDYLCFLILMLQYQSYSTRNGKQTRSAAIERGSEPWSLVGSRVRGSG